MDEQSQVGAATVGHGPEPYSTLGHVAAELRRMQDDGVTRESIEFALHKVYG